SEVTKVVAPGVTEVRRVAIAARGRGEIALAYLGRSDGSQFDGYITATANALADRIVFWSATVNHPTEPLVNSTDEQTFGDRFFPGPGLAPPRRRHLGRVPLRQDRRLPWPAARRDGTAHAARGPGPFRQTGAAPGSLRSSPSTGSRQSASTRSPTPALRNRSS